MENKYVNDLIAEAVAGFTATSYDYLDEIKVLVFTYLLHGFTYEEFEDKLNKVNLKYNKKINTQKKKDTKDLKEAMKEKNKEGLDQGFQISKEDLDKLKFKFDKHSQIKAQDKYLRVIKQYYKDTNETLQKEYIVKEDYLSSKLDKFDKVERVVPYFSKATGKVVAYHDIASYNSMVYNTNLTSMAWNSTYDACEYLGEDKVYVEPHPYACDNCREWQGRFYSMSGKDKSLPPLQEALDNGLKHPNCKHIITTDVGQEETDDFKGEEWSELYDIKQKRNAVQLKMQRLTTDRDIYEDLNNQSKVDKINQQLETLASELTDLESQMPIKQTKW